ncbi:MAG: hypothetical protein GC201_10555 [Alphaproteobacteria bacterium]|nr:hypothetical protein [Alphaproteobacteria bacterium]
MTQEQSNSRVGWIVLGVVVVAVAAGAIWWFTKPWANQAEQAQLAQAKQYMQAYFDQTPPAPGWKVLDVKVAPPGLVVDVEMPEANVKAAEQMPVANRLMTAGALCPERTDPIYRKLGRFDLEFDPQADGKPVLTPAGCRNVRSIPAA